MLNQNPWKKHNELYMFQKRNWTIKKYGLENERKSTFQ